MRGRFWIAVAIQVLVLLSMVGVHGYTLMLGEPVTLRARVVDPWDPMRGAYLSLYYDIDELSADLPMAGWPYSEGDRVWVTLAQGSPYWTAVAVSDRRPEAGTGQVVLPGWVLWTEEPGRGEKSGRVAVRYGIEQLYVPEGQGQNLEGREVELTVAIRVDRTGRSAIHTVYLDGKPIDWR